MTSAQPLSLKAEGARIMAVFAHPDDEAFAVAGTLAAYAQAGAEITLVCATRGEAGKMTDPSMTVTDLGQQREAELRAACQAIGIPVPVFLGYHDSGRFERTRHDDPLALMNVDVLDIEDKLRALIEERRPHVLITFDPHGGYGHVDHLQMQRATVSAFFSTGHLPYGGPQRLYYTVFSSEVARNLNMMDPTRELEPERYGISEATAAVKMNVAAYAEQKKAALAAHGT
ncbi:PIG-L deacetylase family protein [Deinococcus sp. Marseille-Q6407]|uniref:PIG-L deacetylase family protein n=1 Tax=Deinococcus sp. Marseille-Q6407 TaxID=2969223 RepID=UPI0028FC165D|nr:PIG-L deacetylase family protein [Deinococcus sp. Marseille-Q6407]